MESNPVKIPILKDIIEIVIHQEQKIQHILYQELHLVEMVIL